MTRTTDGPPDPVTEHLRGADLRVHAPQSAIPTQGGPPFPPRSGPFPMGPRVMNPPGAPAQRSPLLNPQGRPTPLHPSGEQTPLHDDGSVPLGVRLAAWGRRFREVVSTPAGRWSLIGVVAVVQVFLLFSTAMWWTGGSTAVAESKIAPMTWTGIVHDTGPAGVYLRSEARVDPATVKDTAGQGSRLAVSCGMTGDEVRNGTVHTATWLKTTDGLLVSMLYVRVPDRQSIPSCADSTVDAPLLALSDPANPELPPPPGTSLEGSGDRSGTSAVAAGGTARPRVAAAAGAGLPAAGPGAAPVGPGQVVAPSVQAPAPANTGGGGTGNGGTHTPDQPKQNTPPPSSSGAGTAQTTSPAQPASTGTPTGPVG